MWEPRGSECQPHVFVSDVRCVQNDFFKKAITYGNAQMIQEHLGWMSHIIVSLRHALAQRGWPMDRRKRHRGMRGTL